MLELQSSEGIIPLITTPKYVLPIYIYIGIYRYKFYLYIGIYRYISLYLQKSEFRDINISMKYYCKNVIHDYKIFKKCFSKLKL